MHVLVAEVLPDEAPDRPHALLAQMVDLVELVVLVAEHDLDRVRPDPVLVLAQRHVVLARLGDPGLIPDGVDLAGRGRGRLLRPRPRAGPGEDEGLVPELLERRADLARDDRLPRGDPLGDDADPQGGRLTSCG